MGTLLSAMMVVVGVLGLDCSKTYKKDKKYGSGWRRCVLSKEKYNGVLV